MPTKDIPGDLEGDWYGNNAAFRCPLCGKTFLVSAVIGKKPRPCPSCGQSKAMVTKEYARIEW